MGGVVSRDVSVICARDTEPDSSQYRVEAELEGVILLCVKPNIQKRIWVCVCSGSGTRG